MERSLTPTGKDEEVEEEEQQAQVKTLESPKKAVFYIYHPSHFLQQLLKSLFKCLGFHEISVPNKSFNAAASNQYDVAPSSPSEQASDPPSTPTTTTSTDQQIGASTLARRTPSRRPGPTTGPGPGHN